VYAPLAREYEEVVRYALETKRDGRRIADDEATRQRLAELAVDMEVARLMSLRSTWLLEEHVIPEAEGSVNKVWNADTRLRISSLGLDLMGEDGQLRVGSDGAPNRGRTELFYRQTPVFRFAAGAQEIQKNIIAERGLGLPRA
jgi:alkylation response protein AidB-like acyl-CoA dehydrogenase